MRRPSDLSRLAFGVHAPQAVPAAIYLELVDLVEAGSANSTLLQLPFEPPPPTEPPASAEPTPGPQGWVGPTPVSDRPYWEPSLVLDSSGHVHAAALLDNSIYHVTNASCRWIRERLSTPLPSGGDRSPSIAMDTDGSLWVAFTRYALQDCDPSCVPIDSQGTYLVNNSSGEWSQPEAVSGTGDEGPSLRVRNGIVHLAATRWMEPLGFSVFYTTNSSGSWTEEQLHDKSYAPTLTLGSDGLARILIADGPETFYATAQSPTGSFAIEHVAGFGSPVFALDPADVPHVVAHNINDRSIWYLHRRDGTWSDPVAVDLHGALASGVAVGQDGAAHVVSEYAVGAVGQTYATNGAGSFATTRLYTAGTSGPRAPDRRRRSPSTPQAERTSCSRSSMPRRVAACGTPSVRDRQPVTAVSRYR